MQQAFAVRGKVERIDKAMPLSRLQVRITWEDGASEVKDLEPLLLSHKMFGRVRSEPSLFATLQVSADGYWVMWEDATSLSSRAIMKLPRTFMDAAEFKNIMADLNMTGEGLGSLLGLSRRAVTNYRSGEEIPKSVALAMHFLHQRWYS